MSNSVISVISRFLEEYTTTTPNKLKVVDAYLLYILLTGALQFLYCLLVGTFPFNSFLSGFISCVGSFILAGKYKSGLYLKCFTDQLDDSPVRHLLWNVASELTESYNELAHQANFATSGLAFDNILFGLS